jgi:hypothetical protein
MHPGHLLEQLTDFRCGQHDGQLPLTARGGDFVEPRKLDVKHPPIEEKQRRASLGLG